ncbi:MAG: hypothetical protein ACI9VR_002850 [Cognaticolwellia sp.]
MGREAQAQKTLHGPGHTQASVLQAEQGGLAGLAEQHVGELSLGFLVGQLGPDCVLVQGRALGAASEMGEQDGKGHPHADEHSEDFQWHFPGQMRLLLGKAYYPLAMFALFLLFSCSTTPPSTWRPLPPPLPVTPGAYEELLLVLGSLPELGDPARDEMQDQVREGVVPEDVVLEHRDLGVLLAAEGLQIPIFGLQDEQPSYFGLLVLVDAAILESRVHLAYGEGLYAWGALAPVLEIAGDLEGAGGGLLPFMVGVSMEQSILREFETVLTTPYGLGREGEEELRRFVLARQARPALAPYALSTECESVAKMVEDPGDIGLESLLYDPDETLALYYDFCQAQLAMMAKPYTEWEDVEVQQPSRVLANRVGAEMLSVLTLTDLMSGRGEVALQVQRGVVLSAVDLRAGHKGQWPVASMPTDPSTGKALLWDGSTLMGGTGIEEMEVSLTLAPPVWSAAQEEPLSDSP